MPDNIPDTLPPEAFQGAPPTSSTIPDTIPANQFVSQEDALQQKYGTLPQTALAGVEGAAQSVLGPLAPATELASGLTTKEAIQGRAAASPITHGAGEAAGLIGGALSGVGLPALMEDIGAGAAASTGLGGIPASAVKAAIENSVFQGSDEFSKMVYGDPDATAQHAAANIGLSGLIGAGAGTLLGAVSPLWEAAAGTKVGQLLTALRDKATGETVTKDAVNGAIDNLGVSVPPEVRAALSDDPTMHEAFTTLQNSDTTPSGQALQSTLKDFNKSVGDNITGAFGYTADSLPSDVSKYEAGKNLGNTLADEFDATVKPLSDRFEQVKSTFNSVPLPMGTIDSVADELGKLADKERWTISPSSDIMREVGRVAKELPNLQTLGDLGAYATRIGENMQADPLNGPLRRAGSLVKGLFRDAEGNTLNTYLKDPEMQAKWDAVVPHGGAPEASTSLGASDRAKQLQDYVTSLRSEWSKAASLGDALDERLSTKSSTSGFGKALREMSSSDGEGVLRRLSGASDASLLELLQNKFPKTAEALRKYHVDSTLEKAANKANPNETINVTRLASEIEKMSPEMRNFAIPAKTQATIDASSTLLKKLKALPQNYSGTARTVDKLFKNIPGTAVGMATGLISHNPIIGWISGKLTQYLSKDAPAALNLALLKAVGSTDVEVNAGAFKSMVDYLEYARKGQAALSSSVKALIKVGPSEALRDRTLNDTQVKSLDKKLQAFQQGTDKQPADSAYLPDHAQSTNSLAGNVAAYVLSKRPTSIQTAPLDNPVAPSNAQRSAYRRLLTIADDPLSILSNVKRGNLQASDVAAINSMYPSLAASMRQQLNDELIKAQSKGTTIPYSIRTGASMLMGEALDSTLSPSSIQAAQASLAPQQPSQAPGVQKNKKSTSSLNKFSEGYATPLQQREMDKSKPS